MDKQQIRVHEHSSISVCTLTLLVLKQAVNWKSQKLAQLIEKLEKLVKFREAKISLFGVGDYTLCGEYSKLYVEQ